MDVKTYLRVQKDRVGAIACVVLGAITLLLGYLGISGTVLTYEQLPYIISGGLLGIGFIGVGTTLWLSADLTDEWRKLDRVEAALLAVAGNGSLSVPAVTQVPDDSALDEIAVGVAPRTRRRPVGRS